MIRARPVSRLLLALGLALWALALWSYSTGYATVFGSFVDARFISSASLPGSEDVVLVIKTGANEIADKLPAHLDTTLVSARNYLIFSDAEDKIGGVPVIDALASANKTLKESHPAFAQYRQQKQLRAEKRDADALPGPASELDKFKAPHILAQTWKRRPRAKWYVFIQADTYVFWPGLVRWLSSLDSNRKLYLGVANTALSPAFAQGGPGYVLSHAGLEAAVADDPDGFVEKYEKAAMQTAWGDFVVGQAMADANVTLFDMAPWMGSLSPQAVGYWEGNWREEVFTLHHVNADQFGQLWSLERALEKSQAPVTHSALFEHFVYPYIHRPMDEWDNLANEEQIWLGWMSIDEALNECKSACNGRPKCLSYRIRDTTCELSTKVSLGRSQTSIGSPRHRSGWIMMRVQALRRFGRLEDPPEHPEY